MAQVQGQPMVRLVPSAPDVFRVVEVNATVTFSSRAGPAESVALVQGPANLTLARVAAEAAAAPAPAPAPAAPPPAASVRRPTAPRNWPSFRGDGGARQRRRPARRHRVGRGHRQEHQVEDRDSRRRHLEPDRLGQPRVRHHRDQPVRRQDLQDRLVWRREAGGGPVGARLEGLQPGQGQRERFCGSARRSPARRRPSGTPRAARPARRPPPTASASWRCSDRRAC